MLRQHRNDHIRQINGVSPPVRFPVKLAARSDIKGHVGNRDNQVKTDIGLLSPHGVVKILGVLTVNRYQRHIGHIQPPLPVKMRTTGQFLGNFFIKNIGDVILVQHQRSRRLVQIELAEVFDNVRLPESFVAAQRNADKVAFLAVAYRIKQIIPANIFF